MVEAESAFVHLMQDRHSDRRFVSALHWKSFITFKKPLLAGFNDLDTNSYVSFRGVPDLSFQQGSIKSVGCCCTDRSKKEENGENAHRERALACASAQSRALADPGSR